MAARKRSAIRPGGMPEAWRERIQATVLVKRLMAHVNGVIELTPAQVSSANILLKKVAPDLQSIAHGQDPALDPIKLEAVVRPVLTREEWLALHSAK